MRCIVCNNPISANKIRPYVKGRFVFCSKRCLYKHQAKLNLIVGIITFLFFFIPGLIMLISLSIEYGYNNNNFLGFSFLFFGLGLISASIFGYFSFKGFQYKKEDAENNNYAKFYCLYCDKLLEPIKDLGPITCSSCGMKTPICNLCSLRINTLEELAIIKPCEHTFHKLELFDWMIDERVCPICKEKIMNIKFDLNKI